MVQRKPRFAVIVAIILKIFPGMGTTQLRGESLDLSDLRATSDWISIYTKFFAVPIKRIVVKYDNQYLRCYKITFKNLYTEIVDDEWQRLNHFFLGNHFLLDVQYPTDDDFTITTFLYETEGIYDTLEEANAIDKKDNIDFRFFCDEIFGDG